MKRSLETFHPRGLLLAAFAAIAIAGCGSRDDMTEKDKQPPAEGVPSAEAPSAEEPAKGPTSASEVLEKMADVYRKTPSYADQAQIRLLATSGDQKIDNVSNIVVAFERPNKLRLEVFQTGGTEDGEMFRAVAICDGERFHAYNSELQDQVVDREAPEKMSAVLVDIMTGGGAQMAPQLALLLSDTALREMTRGSKDPTLEKPGEIGGRSCYRVRMVTLAGPATYWIDKQSFELRRMVLPTNNVRESLGFPGPIDSISWIIDFHNATLGGKSDKNAFRFEIAEGVERVRFFEPPSLPQLLGKKVPEFAISSLDGQTITPQTLAGKIVVMDFWGTKCPPCRKGMPKLQEVYNKYKDNENVVFLAVSVDKPEVNNETLLKALSDFGTNIPLARDLEMKAGISLRFVGIPTTFVIDAKGIVQLAYSGLDPDLTVNLPVALDKLLAGEDTYQKPLDEYLRQRKLKEEQLEARIKAADLPPGSTVEEYALPQVKIAPQSAPKTFKLMPAWTCKELSRPGNILAVPDADGKMKLLVIDAWKSVAELGLDGKLIANHSLGLEQSETVGLLRTAVDGQGKRYFAAVANAQQRFHLFDQQWKLLFRYPEDALESKHAGIADVQLGDADGDGTIKAYVGYWGLVGIQAVSLQGKRLWSNRSITDVLKIAIGGRNQQNQQNLYCINDSGSLEVLNAEGKAIGKVTVENQMLQWVGNADLDGDGQLQWCGLSASQLGENSAIGFNLRGEELWSKALPAGIHKTFVEPIIAGNFSGADAGQWILIGPDGSVHIVSAEGKPVDQFNFGADINGLATATLDDRPLLIISSEEGIQAWFVER